jgi:hypothetical protein
MQMRMKTKPAGANREFPFGSVMNQPSYTPEESVLKVPKPPELPSAGVVLRTKGPDAEAKMQLPAPLLLAESVDLTT